MNGWKIDMQAQGLSDRTIRERLRIVPLAASGSDPAKMTSDDCAAFLSFDGFAQSTRATYAAALRAWFAYLVRTGRRDDNPMDRLAKVRVPDRSPHPVTTDELDRLLSSRLWPNVRAQILLAAYAGLRVHEIAKVRGEDFNRVAQQLRCRGKGGRLDWQPIADWLAAALAYLPERGLWFPSPADSSRPVARASVSAAISRAMARVGIDGSAHSLRHWYGTTLVRSGADLRTVQTLMRHRSLNTTQIYVAVADESRTDAVNRLPHAG